MHLFFLRFLHVQKQDLKREREQEAGEPFHQ
jgi:hypothetical protein